MSSTDRQESEECEKKCASGKPVNWTSAARARWLVIPLSTISAVCWVALSLALISDPFLDCVGLEPRGVARGFFSLGSGLALIVGGNASFLLAVDSLRIAWGVELEQLWLGFVAVLPLIALQVLAFFRLVEAVGTGRCW